MHTAFRAVVAALLLGGCLSNASSTKKLADSVHDMNDEARWGRVTSAAQRVDPPYRGTFLAAHRGWGGAIQVADAEVTHVQVAEGGDHATAFVTYAWYATDNMTLHQSVVRQRWISQDDGYALISESVVAGDARLLGGKGTIEADPNAAFEMGMADDPGGSLQ